MIIQVLRNCSVGVVCWREECFRKQGSKRFKLKVNRGYFFGSTLGCSDLKSLSPYRGIFSMHSILQDDELICENNRANTHTHTPRHTPPTLAFMYTRSFSACTHTHTHKHTHRDTCLHTHKHAHAQTHTHRHTRVRTHIRQHYLEVCINTSDTRCRESPSA